MEDQMVKEQKLTVMEERMLGNTRRGNLGMEKVTTNTKTS